MPPTLILLRSFQLNQPLTVPTQCFNVLIRIMHAFIDLHVIIKNLNVLNLIEKQRMQGVIVWQFSHSSDNSVPTDEEPFKLLFTTLSLTSTKFHSKQVLRIIQSLTLQMGIEMSIHVPEILPTWDSLASLMTYLHESSHLLAKDLISLDGLLDSHSKTRLQTRKLVTQASNLLNGFCDFNITNPLKTMCT